MSRDDLYCLRALGAAADVPEFLHLIKSQACATFIRRQTDENDFRRWQRQGYGTLVLAALSKGLQLYNSNAAAAMHQDSSPGLTQDQQQLVDCLGSLALAVDGLFRSILGKSSPDAKTLEQEVLDSGVRDENILCPPSSCCQCLVTVSSPHVLVGHS
jgi:hypothetical protein